MNPRPDSEDLLTGVLAEAGSATFRESLLRETLRLARRRRHLRQLRPVIALLALLSLLLLTRHHPVQPIASSPPPIQAPQPAYRLVLTQPFPESAIVITRQFVSDQPPASTPAVAQITTTPGAYRELNDDQLLQMLAQKPAALIRTGPHSETLIFVNPADAKGFPIN